MTASWLQQSLRRRARAQAHIERMEKIEALREKGVIVQTEEEKERARARQRQFERWGIIGGPDKGRRPTNKSDSDSSKSGQLSRSI